MLDENNKDDVDLIEAYWFARGFVPKQFCDILM
jgi:hypothetical protein